MASDSVKKRRCRYYPCWLDGSTKGKYMIISSYESLTHSRWNCKYHIVFIPKCRKKALYGKVRTFLGPVFHELASQRGSKIVEGHMVQAPDTLGKWRVRKNGSPWGCS
ncbi:hypothetical protein NEPTK9_001063 [Candidatus Neptunochlamydia vexilliferae]|uniref:Transposase IS200-like domain-containing protein n=1 Tax=Candidatus Neptunichlamydia vexilliferae TaxID=1651774 RepID=A0ABS0AZJ4_9BACT|nr:hypothetical protein [Candidatus Neptunochlamydia vexilliferae]